MKCCKKIIFTPKLFLFFIEDVLLVKYQHGNKFHQNGHCNGKERNAWVILRCEEDGEV